MKIKDVKKLLIKPKISDLKKFNLYKLQFIGIGKTKKPSIEIIDGKKCLTWATKSGLIMNYYVYPLQNPIPVALIIGASAFLAAAGVTIALLKEVKNVSGVFYAITATVCLILISRLKK